MGNFFKKSPTPIYGGHIEDDKITITCTKSENLNYNLIIKILLIGDVKVGKTSIIECLTKNEINHEYIPTIGLEFCTHKITCNDKILKLQLFDSTGNKRFSNIISSYYKGSAFIIVVVDLTNITSIQNSEQYIKCAELTKNANASIVLVGNKTDIDISSENRQEAINIASRHNLKYFEVSALNGSGIHNLFDTLDYSSFVTEQQPVDE